MLDWLKELTFVYQIFYAIGIISLAILIIQMVLLLFGIDHGDTDISHGDVSDPSGVGILSVRTIVAFMVGFGWTGVICQKGGLSIAPTLAISVLVGTFFMFVVFFMMVGLHKLKDSGNVDYNNAVGRIATVYSTISPRKSHAGKVHVIVQGRMREISAITDSDKKILPGAKAKIVELIDPITVLVRTTDTEV